MRQLRAPSAAVEEQYTKFMPMPMLIPLQGIVPVYYHGVHTMGYISCIHLVVTRHCKHVYNYEHILTCVSSIDLKCWSGEMNKTLEVCALQGIVYLKFGAAANLRAKQARFTTQ